jgi:hypothetical protein
VRLVRISHNRCGEHDSTEYLFSPEGWTEEQVNQAVDEVAIDVIEDAKALKQPPGGVRYPPVQPNYRDFPDKTVAEIQRIHEEDRKRYNEWAAENKQLSRSFSERLVERGFTTIYEGSDLKVDVEWGHNHGLSLPYGRVKDDW